MSPATSRDIGMKKRRGGGNFTVAVWLLVASRLHVKWHVVQMRMYLAVGTVLLDWLALARRRFVQSGDCWAWLHDTIVCWDS